MNVRRIAPLLAALFLSSLAHAANHNVSVSSNAFTPSDLTVQQGDTVTFRNSGGGLHNAVSDPGAPNTFRCANGCQGAGGNGNASSSNWTAVVTMSNAGITRYFCEIHGGPGGEGMSGVITVEPGTTVDPPPAARDDRMRLRIGAGPADIDVLANDIVVDAALAGGLLSIVAAPAQGVAAVIDGGNGSTAADDVIRYTLPAGVVVDTTIGYRICDGSDQCDDGQVRVLARGLHDDDLALPAERDAGFAIIAVDGLPALPEARFQTTAMLAPTALQPNIPVDATPATPWDSGRAGTVFQAVSIPAPADGLPIEFGVLVDARPVTAGNIDLFVGADLDGDAQPDENELRCTAAMADGAERCDMTLPHPGTGSVGWWVMVQNRGDALVGARVEYVQVPLRSGGPSLVMTGPGHLLADEASAARIVWNDPTIVAGDVRMAFARVQPTPATGLGWVPVRVDRMTGGDPEARALVSGRDLILRLRAGEAHERIYVDVPPGATSLTVQTASGSNFDLYLARHTTLSHPAVQGAPPRGSAVASGTGGSGVEVLVLAPPQLVPGRWYVTPVNASGVTDGVAVRATVSAAAPAVRPGSYFNPDRSGHGMFLYPAGGDTVWTGLWYHYFEDGSPTWYYLEGAAPGANGVFTSGVYRAAWDGDSNTLVQVGEATLTPSGPDAFSIGYTIDGQSGAEPLAALGRGCPTVSGIERDTSSTWFDPATAGTGYSVQVFPNAYEYNAAFVYDGHGIPRYLAAELPPPPGGTTTTYALEQLTGFCPLCDRTGAPTRQDVGTFTRTLDAGGTLERIEVDAIYTGGVPGAWTGDDMIQPLGGPGTTQGCDP